MKNIFCICFAAALIALFSGSDWLSFRGTDRSNVAPDKDVPVKIGVSENIAWKVQMPGRGPSSPIVIGEQIIVTCSGGDNEDQLYVVSINAKTGQKNWQRRFWATGRCFCHPLSANAAPTPTSDGEHIYAFFSSNDLFCLDLQGNLKWFRGLAVDHPKAGHDAGMSSSPAVHGEVVVCQVENQGDSFATGINKQTGATIWEIERGKDAAWSSPVIFTSGARSCCLLQSPDRATVVDLESGKQVWEVEGRISAIPSTSVIGNRLYIPLNGTTAVEFDDAGNFTEIWNSSRVAASSPSGVVHDNKIYTIGRGGVLNCSNTLNGQRLWQARVEGQYWTTPLVAGNHMYLFTQTGKVYVVRLDGDVEDASQRVVHTAQFEGEVFLGSPAVKDNAIYMRSDKYLYKFAKDPI